MCNSDNSALRRGWTNNLQINMRNISIEHYLFIVCNNSCGFLNLRFCLLQLLPEDFLQLGIEGEKLHSTLKEVLEMHHQIVLSKSVCVYNISIPFSYQSPSLENRKRSDSFITQIPTITKKSILSYSVSLFREFSLSNSTAWVREDKRQPRGDKRYGQTGCLVGIGRGRRISQHCHSPL